MNVSTTVLSPSSAPGRRTRAWRGERGFSLIEMMVVIAILSLAFGLMVPSIAEFLKNRELERAGGEAHREVTEAAAKVA